jgi:hypothetical protein
VVGLKVLIGSLVRKRKEEGFHGKDVCKHQKDATHSLANFRLDDTRVTRKVDRFNTYSKTYMPLPIV